jgi:hypothetical protein
MEEGGEGGRRGYIHRRLPVIQMRGYLSKPLLKRAFPSASLSRPREPLHSPVSPEGCLS